MIRFFRMFWVLLSGRCMECGGKRGCDTSFGHSVKAGIVWAYCFSCGFYCQCVRNSGHNAQADDLVGRSLQYKTERDQLLDACKYLLCVYYGDWGPLGETLLARNAERIVERVDGRPFETKPWIIEAAKRLRLED